MHTNPDTLKNTLPDILAENSRRRLAQASSRHYSPLTGLGATGHRVKVSHPAIPDDEGSPLIPRSMTLDADYPLLTTPSQWRALRIRHDFEYWAARCVTIHDKSSGSDIPFILNSPQRRVVAALEEMRLADQPLRIILLKARQWGGSTLIQLYMAWIQICLRRNWNSLICAHLKDTSATIRGMYSKMLDNYPSEYWEEESAPSFRPFERSTNIRLIDSRGCKITIASAENQESVRGMDIAMAHLSEVAFWRDTAQQNPEGFIRAVCGAINHAPLTLIALESTANGVGNYFHREWIRSINGESDKKPIFVPWYEIDIYTDPRCDPGKVVAQMDTYELDLWQNTSVTLQQIAWYQQKRREYQSHYQMMAEYPSTPDEAFRRLDNAVFPNDRVEAMRQACCEGLRGDIASLSGTIYGSASLQEVRFVECSAGAVNLWHHPIAGRDYVVAVDIGGRSDKADYSVIVALWRDPETGITEIAAQWRGHCDHDLLAWQAARMARYYNNALLIFESNTLEAENIDGDQAEYVLSKISPHYMNLYRREGGHIGFHTNRSTKTMAINELYAAVRDNRLIEHSTVALNEMLVYQTTPSGGFAASPGNHDDCVMARAIAMHVISRPITQSVDRNYATNYIHLPNV